MNSSRTIQALILAANDTCACAAILPWTLVRVYFKMPQSVI